MDKTMNSIKPPVGLVVLLALVALGCHGAPSYRGEPVPKLARQGNRPANYQGLPKLTDALEVARSPYEPVTTPFGMPFFSDQPLTPDASLDQGYQDNKVPQDDQPQKLVINAESPPPPPPPPPPPQPASVTTPFAAISDDLIKTTTELPQSTTLAPSLVEHATQPSSIAPDTTITPIGSTGSTSDDGTIKFETNSPMSSSQSAQTIRPAVGESPLTTTVSPTRIETVAPVEITPTTTMSPTTTQVTDLKEAPPPTVEPVSKETPSAEVPTKNETSSMEVTPTKETPTVEVPVRVEAPSAASNKDTSVVVEIPTPIEIPVAELPDSKEVTAVEVPATSEASSGSSEAPATIAPETTSTTTSQPTTTTIAPPPSPSPPPPPPPTTTTTTEEPLTSSPTTSAAIVSESSSFPPKEPETSPFPQPIDKDTEQPTITTTTTTTTTTTPTAVTLEEGTTEAPPPGREKEAENSEYDKCNFLPTSDKGELQKVFREETTYKNGTIKGRFTYISYDQRYKLVHYTRVPYGPVKIDLVEELSKTSGGQQEAGPPVAPQPGANNNNNILQTRNVFPFGGTGSMMPPFGSSWFTNNHHQYQQQVVPLNGPPFIPLYLSYESAQKFLSGHHNQQAHQLYSAPIGGLDGRRAPPSPTSYSLATSSQDSVAESSPVVKPVYQAHPQDAMALGGDQQHQQQPLRPQQQTTKLYYAPHYATRTFQPPQFYSVDQTPSSGVGPNPLGPSYPIYHLNLNQHLNQRQQQLEAQAVAEVAAQLAETSALAAAAASGYTSGAGHQHEHHMAPFMVVQANSDDKPKLKVKTSKALHLNGQQQAPSTKTVPSAPSGARKLAAPLMMQADAGQPMAMLPPQSTRQRQRSGKQQSDHHAARSFINNQPIVYHVSPRQSALFNPAHFRITHHIAAVNHHNHNANNNQHAVAIDQD